MITPAEIQEKEFPKGVRGYKEEDVDKFLDLLTLDLETLIKENLRLKAEVAALEAELAKSKGSESTVLETLESARKLMNDISVSAEKRAELLLKNAEMDAELIVREARDSAERLTKEHRMVQRNYLEFRDKYQRLLEGELARFQAATEDLLPGYGVRKGEDLSVEKTRPESPGISVEEFEKDITAGAKDRKTLVKVKV